MKLSILSVLTLLLALAPLAAAKPVAIVFDTDMGNDVDDALALAMIHSLQSRGRCELLAVTITKDHPAAAAFVDAVNTFYGRPDIPVGVVRNGPTPEAGRYNLLASKKNPGGDLRYPHDLATGADAPEAVSLMRRLLAGHEDSSVVLIQTGFFTNFRRLLESPPDGISPLSGRDLIQKKVKLLSVMAGSFQTIHDNNRYLEYNVKNDIPSAQKLARDWPTPVIWSGFEIGIAVPYPASSIEEDFEYVTHHPVKEAYYLYNPPPHNRPTWDLTSVLAAVLPGHGYFEFSRPGQVTVEDDGFTRFTPGDGGPHRFLILPQAYEGRLTEALVQLTSQPPR